MNLTGNYSTKDTRNIDLSQKNFFYRSDITTGMLTMGGDIQDCSDITRRKLHWLNSRQDKQLSEQIDRLTLEKTTNLQNLRRNQSQFLHKYVPQLYPHTKGSLRTHQAAIGERLKENRWVKAVARIGVQESTSRPKLPIRASDIHKDHDSLQFLIKRRLRRSADDSLSKTAHGSKKLSRSLEMPKISDLPTLVDAAREKLKLEKRRENAGILPLVSAREMLAYSKKIGLATPRNATIDKIHTKTKDKNHLSVDKVKKGTDGKHKERLPSKQRFSRNYVQFTHFTKAHKFEDVHINRQHKVSDEKSPTKQTHNVTFESKKVITTKLLQKTQKRPVRKKTLSTLWEGVLIDSDDLASPINTDESEEELERLMEDEEANETVIFVRNFGPTGISNYGDVKKHNIRNGTQHIKFPFLINKDDS